MLVSDQLRPMPIVHAAVSVLSRQSSLQLDGACCNDALCVEMHLARGEYSDTTEMTSPLGTPPAIQTNPSKASKSVPSGQTKDVECPKYYELPHYDEAILAVRGPFQQLEPLCSDAGQSK